jgi:hypothetical protein
VYLVGSIVRIPSLVFTLAESHNLDQPHVDPIDTTVVCNKHRRSKTQTDPDLEFWTPLMLTHTLGQGSLHISTLFIIQDLRTL